MKKVIISMSVIIYLIFLFLLFPNPSRTKVLKQVDSQKIEELYFFESMPIKFKRYQILSPDKSGNNYFITEAWSKGPNNLDSLLFLTSFNTEKDLELNKELSMSNNESEEVIVKEVSGYYLIDSFPEFVFERIIFVIDGVEYEVIFEHFTEIELLGSEFMINFINEYLIKK